MNENEEMNDLSKQKIAHRNILKVNLHTIETENSVKEKKIDKSLKTIRPNKFTNIPFLSYLNYSILDFLLDTDKQTKMMDFSFRDINRFVIKIFLTSLMTLKSDVIPRVFVLVDSIAIISINLSVISNYSDRGFYLL
ncbi:hypothetical protein BpHYR1_044950 [Brachionus plicatilis]|uniref:Uncharacterized protein n=1 Tax=Brachionus plicatilis TaxID=10195 RepID=A0A3M7S0P3_BRAPC|nr:hypothetical protein BpHYR1_044950 [Brachionus plicatilis]